jgi:hypothetical protein
MSKHLTAIAAVALLAACGGNNDPVSFSEPVGISLSVASKDVVSGAVSADKNINTENGNPYGAFTSAARARLGGRDPSHIAVTGATLELLTATSTGVTALEQVFTGPVSVAFQVGASGTVYPVGQVMNPVGAGPVTLNVAFDSASLLAADRAAITQGQFKVVLGGTSASGFAGASATADLRATLMFVAYE